jgi:hypothetical protein
MIHVPPTLCIVLRVGAYRRSRWSLDGSAS